MQPMKHYLLICVIGILSCFTACVKDIDFDQAENIELRPIVDLDFFYSIPFDLSVFEFLPPGQQAVPARTESDTLNFDLLGSEFILDNIERVEIDFEVPNSIESEFALEFNFLGENNQSIGPLGTDQRGAIAFKSKVKYFINYGL